MDGFTLELAELQKVRRRQVQTSPLLDYYGYVLRNQGEQCFDLDFVAGETDALHQRLEKLGEAIAVLWKPNVSGVEGESQRRELHANREQLVPVARALLELLLHGSSEGKVEGLGRDLYLLLGELRGHEDRVEVLQEGNVLPGLL